MLLICLSGAVIPLTPSAPSAASSRVYVASDYCRGHSVQPARIILACGNGEVWATNLRFSAYGAGTAWASGKVHYVVCQPNCAQGYVKSVPTRIKLTKIVMCAGRRYYGRATVVNPARFSPSVWYIQPLGC
jgi:hypothetical protein